MDLQKLKKEFETELNENILNYWVKKVYDPVTKTFYGRIALDETPDPSFNKSAVLITRILWAFSAAYRKYPKPEYKLMADEAYRIITNYFWDTENGGIFWEITGDHKPADTKKQFYALAFCIYACSEYFMTFGNKQAKELAISVYIILEAKSFNPANKGYIDVLSKDWKKISGLRLSEKEIADTMTMNTHLHILEAYTNLFRIWKENELKQKLENLLRLFLDKIISHQTWHFNLFFDDGWNNVGDVDSYGHDIEGTWLLYEAAEVLGDKSILKEVEDVAIKMAKVTINEGLVESFGGLLYEKENGHLLEEYHWWPQAETVIGFFNLFQITDDTKYLELAVKSWEFIKNHIIDQKRGEWFWGLDKNLSPLPIEKVNGWKGPYHNGRMCLELIGRIEKVIKK
jgi:cellobiose epimerase